MDREALVHVVTHSKLVQSKKTFALRFVQNVTHSTLDVRNLLQRTDVSTASTKNMASKTKNNTNSVDLYPSRAAAHGGYFNLFT